MISIKKHIYILVILINLSSCAFKKKFIYFNSSSIKTQQKNFFTTLKSGDILNIDVFNGNKESVEPFNFPKPNTNSIAGYVNGIPATPGYVIDNEGYIDFPTIGKIKIMGLTTIEATNLIKEQIKTYVSNPVINLRILNFKVTVLGEVRNPNTFLIPNERITILEALGLAGDLLISGVRKEVIVIRDINGIKQEYTVDLTSKDIFDSPVYYLTQNDVVYVKPNQAKINSSTVSSSYGIFISIASLLITTINVISK